MKYTFALGLLAITGVVHAQERDGEVPAAALAVESVSDGSSLPLTLGASQPYAALVGGFSGYDSAHETALVDVYAQVRLWGPLSIRGGATYVSNGNTLKPTVGGLVQFLRQSKHGVSATFGVFYKPEGLTEPEGEIEGIVSVARRFGPTTVAVNLVYGQDPEATESDAEVRGALLVNVTRPLFLGLDTRARFAINQNPMKAPVPDLDLVTGTVATYVVAGFAVSAQAGLSLVNAGGATKTGVIGQLGISRAF